MNNRHEINPQFNHPEIPENWNYPFKGDPKIKPIQVELKQKFLAVLEGDLTRAEYFFDNKGDYSDSDNMRREQFPHSSGDLLGQTSICLYGDMATLFGGHDTINGKNADILVASYNPSEKNRLESSLAEFRFKQSRLFYIRLPSLFYLGEKEGKIVSPYMVIQKNEEKTGENIEDWLIIAASPVQIKHKQSTFVNKKQNEFLIEIRDKDRDFECSWDIVDGKLVVAQTHLKTGIAKVLKSPLKIDQEKINATVSCQPPYEIIKRKDWPDKLSVPWTRIQEVIGASIGYKQPLPTGFSEK